MAPSKLAEKFWIHFAKKIWEQKPLLLKNVKAPILKISEDEIFQLLLAYSDRCRKLKDSQGFKFFIDGLQATPQDVLQILPLKKDKNLTGYHKRTAALFKDYCLVCDELLKVSAESQSLLTDFTDQLFRHVGWPNQFSEMGLYLGNYRQTPFGVHVDQCGVFSFPVVGTKKFRIWKPSFAERNPKLDRALKYDQFKKSSTVLTANSGDMVYWPSSAWHIAESDGSFSATWSLGVWVNKSHQTFFNEALSGLLHDQLGPAGKTSTIHFSLLHAESGEMTELPDAFKDSLKVLRNLTEAELHDALATKWMQHVSKKGLKNNPATAVIIQKSSSVRLRQANAKILWKQSPIQKTKILISFGGQLINSSSSSGLLKLIKSLNLGKICSLKECLKGPHGPQNLQAVKLLAAAGALRLVTHPNHP